MPTPGEKAKVLKLTIEAAMRTQLGTDWAFDPTRGRLGPLAVGEPIPDNLRRHVCLPSNEEDVQHNEFGAGCFAYLRADGRPDAVGVTCGYDRAILGAFHIGDAAAGLFRDDEGAPAFAGTFVEVVDGVVFFLLPPQWALSVHLAAAGLEDDPFVEGSWNRVLNTQVSGLVVASQSDKLLAY